MHPFQVAVLAAAAAAGQSLQGCYKDDGSLPLLNTYIYQSSGYCLGKCSEHDAPVMATSSGSACYCGDTIPAEKVDSSFCNTSCSGYPQEHCGGSGYLSVYLTGTGGPYNTSPKNASSSSDSSSSSPSSPSPDHTVIIFATPGAQKPSSGSSSAPKTNSTSQSPPKGNTLSPAAAAGTAVALIAVIIAIGALFFFIRRRAAKNDYIRHDQTPSRSSIMAFGRPSPSTSAKDSAVDQRLEPVMVQRRISEGSLADEQDYSRKILRVTNPDTF